jgi:hypothetical protein
MQVRVVPLQSALVVQVFWQVPAVAPTQSSEPPQSVSTAQLGGELHTLVVVLQEPLAQCEFLVHPHLPEEQVPLVQGLEAEHDACWHLPLIAPLQVKPPQSAFDAHDAVEHLP